jgi:hypothetical protein
MKWLLPVVGVALVAFASRGGADPTRARAALPAVTASGIERDPETGGWRLAPLGGEAPDDRSSPSHPDPSRSDAGLVMVPIPGGGEFVDLQGRFQSFWVVQRGFDGRLASICDVDPIGLLRWELVPIPPRPVDPAPLR